MKKDIFKNENFKLLVLLFSVSIILVSIVLIAFFISNKNNKKHEEYNYTTSKLIDKSLKGYTEVPIDINNIKYNIYDKYEFVYGGSSESSITTNEDEMEFVYDLSIEEGKLVFKERYYDYNKSAYISTNKKYDLALENKILEYFVCYESNKNNYAIVVLDSTGTIYYYVNSNTEPSINDILENFKRYKAISKVKRIGYYTLNNTPNKEAGYELIYIDKDNNVRKLNNKNDYFYKDLYYTYISNNDLSIIIEENGKMHYYNDTSIISDNGNSIIYAGSFIKNNDIYIISKDKYLYKINSKQLSLNKVKNNKISRMGYHIIANETDHDSGRKNVKFIFDNGEELVIDNTTNLNLLF